jgi:hypothetical protein
LPAAIAAFASASVIGAATAKDARAVATAPAKTAAPTVDLVDMFFISHGFGLHPLTGRMMINSI